MSKFAKPKSSIWGRVDNCDTVVDGVYMVNTPGHGGVMVRKDVASRLFSLDAVFYGEEYKEWLCYEEDCAWAIAAYELWKHNIKLPNLTIEELKNYLKTGNEEYYKIVKDKL